MKDNLNLLEKIEQVEVSPFLYTRILQKIEYSKLNDIPKPLAWTLASISTICLVLTLVVVSRNVNTQNDSQALSESVDFVPNNSLYHD